MVHTLSMVHPLAMNVYLETLKQSHRNSIELKVCNLHYHGMPAVFHNLLEYITMAPKRLHASS